MAKISQLRDRLQLAAQEREGIVRSPSRRLDRELLSEPPAGKRARVLAALLEERESNR
jgi:hypothetical protein